MTETIIPGAGRRSAPDTVRAARVLLARACRGVPTPALSDAVTEYGPLATLEAVRADPGAARAFYGVTVTEDDEAPARADLDTAAAAGARFLVPEDDGWPELAVMGWQRGSPAGGPVGPVTVTAQVMGLWVRGPAPLTGGPRVAVTGSRAASDYGCHVAHDFSTGLAAAGVRIVTGGALGIEAAALHGAVAADGAPVVVLPCGIDRVHPAAHADLFDHVVAHGGSMVSPYPPGLAVRRDRAMGRLRLIAGLADAVLVVEAGERSTALHLAGDAHEHSRAVLVVPGPVTSAVSAGAHRLAREPWAQIVPSVDDVVADLTAHRRAAADAPGNSTRATAPGPVRGGGSRPVVTADPGTPVRGPGSGRRPGSRVPRSIRCPPARWPGGADDPAGQAWRLQEQHSLLAGDPLDTERARRAITAARAVYAAHHHLSLVLGVDEVPGAGYIRAQAGSAAVRAIYGPEPIHAPARDAVHTAMRRAGLLP